MNLPYIIHPADTSLYEFAAGELSASDQKKMASHLERCQRCRDRVTFRRELNAAINTLPRIEPPSGLLQRILDDRAAGERAILPVGDLVRSNRTLRFMRIGAVAAAVVVITIVAVMQRRSSSVPTFVSATVFFPEVASAGEPTGPRVDIRPFAPQIDGSRLRVREVEYRQYMTDSSGKRSIVGTGTTSVRRIDANGLPAFRIERTWIDYRNSGAILSKQIDAAVLDARDLHFVERHVDVAPYGKYSRITVEQRFNGDSIYGKMMSEGGDSRSVGRSFLRRLPRASLPYATDAVAPIFFTAIPVASGWRGRVSVLGWAVRDNDVFYPVDIRVVGREPITVPAGSFDCWHLVITYRTREHDFWIRTSDGLGVRVLNVSDKPVRSVVETVLLNDKP